MEKYRCPITRLIFRDPVVASDGQVYERKAILKWLKEKKRSPLTNRQISRTVYPIYYVKEEICELIKKDPTLEKERFKKGFEMKEIDKIMKEGRYEELYEYTDFSLRYKLNSGVVLKRTICGMSEYFVMEPDDEETDDEETNNEEMNDEETNDEETDDEEESSFMEEESRSYPESYEIEESDGDVYVLRPHKMEQSHNKRSDDESESESDGREEESEEEYEYIKEIVEDVENTLLGRLLSNCDKEEIIRYVIDNSLDREEDDALKIMCVFGKKDMIMYMIDKRIRTIPTGVLLWISYYKGDDIELLKYLADKKGVKLSDVKLYEYYKKGSKETISYLIENGANINYDYGSMTPLEYMLKNKKVEMEVIRICIGLIKKIRYGKRAREYACRRADLDLETLKLIEEKSDELKCYKTLLDIAWMHCKKNIILYVLNETESENIRTEYALRIITSEAYESAIYKQPITRRDMLGMNIVLTEEEREEIMEALAQRLKEKQNKINL